MSTHLQQSSRKELFQIISKDYIEIEYSEPLKLLASATDKFRPVIGGIKIQVD
ncbi:hypothetical protein [Paenibacillus tianmuensis]|uniref:hypothetical protein n=1 Tax=Paenibacillus tianmuensis TaxID=624147 RepID=UPI00143136CA|nr:hypothetical protein [Paenibacillus tianmuensis]